jgi:hypothetical protein
MPSVSHICTIVGVALLVSACVTAPKNVLMKPGWTTEQQRADLIACYPGRIDPSKTGPGKVFRDTPTPSNVAAAGIIGGVSGAFSALDAVFLQNIAVWECMNKKGYAPRYLSVAEQSTLAGLSTPEEKRRFVLSLEPRRMPEKPSDRAER